MNGKSGVPNRPPKAVVWNDGNSTTTRRHSKRKAMPCDLEPRFNMYIEKLPAVYIVASRYRGTVYTGVTSNLYDRISAHKQKIFKGFSTEYDCKNLVLYENHPTMSEAIKRETQIKAWGRNWKIELIERFNRNWLDLHENIEHRLYAWEKRGSKSPAKGGRLE
jgi:putative endonuclease